MVKKAKTTTKKTKLKKEPQKESKLRAKEIEDLIVDMGRSAVPTEKIGDVLRKEHGVLDVKELTGKRILQILRENDAAPKIPPDLDSLIKKATEIRKHVGTHKKDSEAKYGLMLTESKILSLARYYKRKGILPADWKYELGGRAA